MNLITNPAQQAQFTDAVLAHLAPRKAHGPSGTKDGEESVSFLKTVLREKGWKIGGHDCDFHDTLRAAGFSIREHKAGRAYRFYVGV